MAGDSVAMSSPHLGLEPDPELAQEELSLHLGALQDMGRDEFREWWAGLSPQEIQRPPGGPVLQPCSLAHQGWWFLGQPVTAPSQEQLPGFGDLFPHILCTD